MPMGCEHPFPTPHNLGQFLPRLGDDDDREYYREDDTDCEQETDHD